LAFFAAGLILLSFRSVDDLRNGSSRPSHRLRDLADLLRYDQFYWSRNTRNSQPLRIRHAPPPVVNLI
jgi:hypothetical protein